jgi:cell division protein ZapA (FtsZ GTPase activity inhibitor)
MRTTYTFLSGLALVGLQFFTSCASERNAATGYSFSEDEYSPDGEKDRMIQQSASLEMRVNEPDSINAHLLRIAKRYEGYVVRLGDRGSTIRVEAASLNDAVNDVAMLGKVRSKSLMGEDVTEQYVDVEIRLENARKARDRYLELLKQAENVQAALLVEKELERLNGEIELLEGKASKLKHLSDMATISVDLDQREKLGPLGYVCVGTWKGVKWLFVRS